MPLNNLKTILFLFACSFLSLGAQRTAVFNGKTYFVYPQVIPCEYEYYSSPLFQYTEMTMDYVMLPPVIGDHKDGEYLIYTTNYTLKNKRKVHGEKVYDTVYQVYATFSIRNNKKEGNASIYKWNKQDKVYVVLPYKNDLLDGDVVIRGYIGTYYNEAYHPFYGGQGRYFVNSDYFGSERIFELHFSEGLLSDSVSEYGFDHKERVLISRIQLRNGMPNGIGRRYNFKSSGRRATPRGYMEGYFVNGRMEGEWLYHKMDGRIYSRESFSAGYLTREMFYAGNGDLSSGFIYGRDSVLTHFPDPAAYPRMPYINSRFYLYEYDYTPPPPDKVIFYRKNGQLRTAFILDEYASANYYLEYDTSDYIVRDTVHEGRIIRTMTSQSNNGGKFWRIYLIDTCESGESSGAKSFCEVLLAKKATDKHGKVYQDEKERSYYQYYFKDSFRSVRVGTFTRDHIIRDRFYYPAKDYMYSNYTATEGSIKGARIYHKISGSTVSEVSIIRCVSLPSSYDTICLVDTICYKGKFLYHTDDYFQDEFDRFVRDMENSDNIFTEKIKSFIELEPVKHTCVMLGKSVFSGQLTIFFNYSDKLEKVRSEVYNSYIVDPFYADKEIVISICYAKGNLKLREGISSLMPENRREYLIRNGAFDNRFKSYDVFGKYYYSARFDKNRLSGSLNAALYKMDYRKRKSKHRGYSRHWREYNYRSSKYRKIKQDRMKEEYEIALRYLNGEKEGQLKHHNYSNTELLTFHHDQLHGTQYYLSGDYIEYVMNFMNDTLEGRSYQMGSNGYPLYMIDFRKGKPHGNMMYFGGMDTTRYVQEKFPFENGYLIGDFLQYTDTGTLKLRIHFEKKDSIYFKDIGKRKEFYHEGEASHVRRRSAPAPPVGIFRQVHYGRLYSRGYYTYYYPNGDLFKQGFKEWGKPVGNWTFYREGKNRTYKVIDFMDTVFNANTPDSMHVYGLVKAYYDDGRPMFKGYALDRRSKFSCEADGDMPMEENHYLEFYDTLGNNILKNGSGYVVEYQSTGHKYREGRLDSFEKEGFWIHYSKFGLPEEMGIYKNGRKNGRWLEGDLAGLNLDETVCFMSDDEFRFWVNMYGGDLTLTEVYYVDGREVSRNTVDVIRN